MRLKILYLVSVCLFAVRIVICQDGEVYTITRLLNDVFKVPSSNCTSNGAECTSYNNAWDAGHRCKCSCPYEASMFGFYSGSWTCLGNTIFRRQAGCRFLFYTDFSGAEMNSDPLMVLGKETSRSYHAIFPSSDCTVNYAASRYFDCAGAWKTLRSREKSNFVNIINRQRFPWDSDLYHSWKHTFQISTTSLAGRIVSLQFNCSNPLRSSCLLFKIAGEITCPAVIRPATSTTPTPTTVTTTGSNFTKSPGPRNSGRHSGSSTSSSPSPGIIVATVFIVIFVILIAVVIGFVFWKKKRGEDVLLMDKLLAIVKNRSTSTTAAVGDTAEEEVYTEIPDHLVQRQVTRTDMLVRSAGVNNYAFNEPVVQPQPVYDSPEERYASLVRSNTNSMMQEEPLTDEEGYLEPRELEFPVYVEFKGIEEQDTNTKNPENNKTNTETQQNEQNASNSSGEGSGVTPVVYACVNKKRKLPKLPTVPSDAEDTEQEKEQHYQQTF